MFHKYLVELAVERCPSLVDLKIDIDSRSLFPIVSSLTPVFERGNWASLGRLSLAVPRCGKQDTAEQLAERNTLENMKAEFFARHTKIRALSLGREPSLSPGALSLEACSHLRALHFFDNDLHRMKILPPELARSLTFLSESDIAKFLAAYGQNGLPSLRTVAGGLVDSDLELLAELCPEIERLILWHSMPTYGEEVDTERISLLQQFTKLTHLAGFIEVAKLNDVGTYPTPLLAKLASLESLQFVEIAQVNHSRGYMPIFDPGPFTYESKWFELERDTNGQFIQIRPAELKRDIPPDIRGGFFCKLEN